MYLQGFVKNIFVDNSTTSFIKFKQLLQVYLGTFIKIYIVTLKTAYFDNSEFILLLVALLT